MNKKWNNSALNCESAYSNHWIVTAKIRRGRPRVPQETLAVRKKRADVKTASQCNMRNPTNINTQKLKKTQNELTNVYQKEQTEYIQNQITKIRDSVEDRQFRIAWLTVNEVRRRKSTAKATPPPNKHKCLKTKNGTISISRHIYKGTDRIHSKSDR